MKTCIYMFIKTLFIVAKTWKQPSCPSVGEWMDKQKKYCKNIVLRDLSQWDRRTGRSQGQL